MELLEEAEADIQEGRIQPMDELLAEVKSKQGAKWDLISSAGVSIKNHTRILEAVRRIASRSSRIGD